MEKGHRKVYKKNKIIIIIIIIIREKGGGRRWGPTPARTDTAERGGRRA